MQQSGVVPVATCPPCIECSPMPPPERKVERVPFQRKVVTYEEYEYEEKVPRQVSHIQYDEVKRIQRIPVQKVVTDYYAVEVVKQLVPQVQHESKTEIVPVERVIQKTVFKPVVKKMIYTSTGQPIQETRLGQFIASRQKEVSAPELRVLPPTPPTYQEVRPAQTYYNTNWPQPQQNQTYAPQSVFNTREDYERFLRGVGMGDNLSYSQFLKVLTQASSNRVPESVAGSIWDRAADNDRAKVTDLAASMYQISRDSKQIKTILNNLA